jgi:hypothetical protein
MAFTTQAAFVDNTTVLNAAFMNAFEENLRVLRNGNDQWVKLYLDSSPSTTNNVSFTIPWTTIAFGSAGQGIWSAANPTRLTAPLTGKYLLLVNQEWRSNSNNLRNMAVLRSAGGASQYDLTSQGATGGKSNLSGKLVLSMTAGQYLEVQAFQSSGGALTLHGGAEDRTRVAMIYLGGDSTHGVWSDPADWALGVNPNATQLDQELINNVLSLRNLNDQSIRLHRTSVQSMPNNTRQPISWQAAAYQTGLTWSSGTNPSRITVNVTGWYLLAGNIEYANVVGGIRRIGWHTSANLSQNFDLQAHPGNGVDTTNGLELIYLTAGDYIEVYGYQNTGGSINTVGTNEGIVWMHLSLLATGGATTLPWKAPKVWVDGFPTGTFMSPAVLNTYVRDMTKNLRNFKGAGAKVYLSEDQSMSQGVRGPITWDTPVVNVGGIWEGSKFTALVDGVYLVAENIEWADQGGAGVQGVGYRIDDTSTAHDVQFQEGTSTSAEIQSGADLVYLRAGQFLEFFAFQDSPESLSIHGGSEDRSRASVVLLAAAA